MEFWLARCRKCVLLVEKTKQEGCPEFFRMAQMENERKRRDMKIPFRVKHPLFWFFRKHPCPRCGEAMVRKEKREIVRNALFDKESIDKLEVPRYASSYENIIPHIQAETARSYAFQCPRCAYALRAEEAYRQCRRAEK